MSSSKEVRNHHERTKTKKSQYLEDNTHKHKEMRSKSSDDSSRETKHNRDKHESLRQKSSGKKKKKKKKRKSSSSSDSSSSGDSDAELKLLQKLEAERIRIREEKRKQKELMKANETPEQKRARRLKEKQEKERKRRERMGWDNEYQCYTNQDNPFGDSALTNTFVWTKKLAKEGVKNVSRDELELLNKQKQLENKIELEKVKQRRLEREAERAAREEEAGAEARAREAAQFHSWARQEDAFHLQQARLRSQIRIRDGRAKPIDLLAWYVSSEECADALEMHEPYAYLNGLQARDLEDLLEDIKVYKELECSANQPYWADVETIVADELGKLRRRAAPGGAAGEGAAARADGVHRAVADDVTKVFKGKTGAQLEALRAQVERKLAGQRAGVDVGYWESLLSQLKAHMARLRLRERHQHNLRRKLQLLKQEQGVSAAPPESPPEPAPALAPAASASADGAVAMKEESKAAGRPADVEEEEEAEVQEAEEAACVALYASGRYSPACVSARVLEPGTLVTEPAEDAARLAYLRARSAGAAHRPPPRAATAAATTTATTAHAESEELERAAGVSGAGGGDAPFGGELALPEQPCLWADKYRPRKPRYFNRVHTGFEWNKYNQTHYDMDNPPPKIVQGYKFNIFYPDLIEPGATPQFSLKPCPENGEFAVLRFHAGPPYEDIAFKIVNREWEYSYKRGFRCHFHNNIFQLWFHFKRYRYRR